MIGSLPKIYTAWAAEFGLEPDPWVEPANGTVPLGNPITYIVVRRPKRDSRFSRALNDH